MWKKVEEQEQTFQSTEALNKLRHYTTLSHLVLIFLLDLSFNQKFPETNDSAVEKDDRWKCQSQSTIIQHAPWNNESTKFPSEVSKDF